jgi:hypothetical protein
MVAVAVAPIVLKNVLFQVDVDDYAAHVSRVEFVPTPSSTTWKGLAPSAVFNGNGLSTWVANVELAQDWKTPKSLARYLYAHEGESKVVKFQPVAGATEPTWTVTLTIVPGAIGGAVDTVPTATVTMQCAGKPVPDYDNTPGTPNPAD